MCYKVHADNQWGSQELILSGNKEMNKKINRISGYDQEELIKLWMCDALQ